MNNVISDEAIAELKKSDDVERIQQVYLDAMYCLLLGKVSVSVQQYTEFAVEGRVIDMPLNLVKRFGHGITLLSPLSTKYSHYDYHINLDFELDDFWFKSVFGASYNELCDNTAIFDNRSGNYYVSNTSGQRAILWVQFENYRRCLVIRNQLRHDETQNKYFYEPFYITSKLYDFKEMYDFKPIKAYKDKVLSLVVPLDGQVRQFIKTERGFLPISTRTQVEFDTKTTVAQFTNQLPKYNDVIRIIKNVDNFIVNVNNEVIGTQLLDLVFFWKPEKLEHVKLTDMTHLYISSYPYYRSDELDMNRFGSVQLS